MTLLEQSVLFDQHGFSQVPLKREDLQGDVTGTRLRIATTTGGAVEMSTAGNVVSDSPNIKAAIGSPLESIRLMGRSSAVVRRSGNVDYGTSRGNQGNCG